MTPEEIRSARRRLGITQVEAGELLGGGPRAFTKYEAGTVKPAASIIKLLRLLEIDPAKITALRGPRGRPMKIHSGPRPFEVAAEHIEAFDERAFPMLLRRLLSAEAQTHGLPADGIHVPDSIHAPDGGEDGRIAWEGGLGRTPFLPSRCCQFQLKTGKIAPGRAAKDVLARDEAVKDMVRPVLQAGGHYIMLCAHRYTQSAIEKREKRIREALRGAGMTIADEQVQFRDAGKIADWVNNHPAIALWVLEKTQPGIVGPFRSWHHWAGRDEHERSPWIEDERLPALRAHLCKQIMMPRGKSRVIGLSGVGKSRLVLQALGPNEESDGSFSDIVLYADESEASLQAINGIVQTWASMGARAVVVVDRCPPESHEMLTGAVSRSGSRLSLITIDNEIPSGTLNSATIKIDEAPVAVIEAVVRQSLPGMPSEDERRIVRFSKGYPAMAARVAQAWTEKTPVAHATDDWFVEAFVLGRRPREKELLLKSAALLAVFGLAYPSDEQLGEIAALGRNIEVDDLRVAIERLVNRGVAQRRGRFVAIQPLPIALNLAERQWREWRECKWDRVLTGDISVHLKVRASRRLALLNTTDVSGKAVTHVCRPGGPFDNCEGVLDSGRAQVLSDLAEINPKIVANRIERSLNGVDDLLKVGWDTRQHLVLALEKIAFHSDTFEAGARLLLRLALAENEPCGNNASGQFTRLFPVFLGNTAANGQARLRVLNEAVNANDSAQRALAVNALIAALKIRNAYRLLGAESHGSHPALKEWFPATKGEMADYINGCVSLLVRSTKRSDSAGMAARAGLGCHFRALVGQGFIETVERAVHEVREMVGPWTEAIEGLSHWLEYDAPETDSELIARVEKLTVRLKPKDLGARVRFLVTEMPWDFPCGEKLDFETRERRQIEAIRDLAVDLVKQPDILMGVLGQLSQGNQRMTFVFGKALASFVPSPPDLLDRIVAAVVEAPENRRNFDLLSGYVTGLAENHPDIVDAFKKRMANSIELAPALPLICWRLGISESDVRLVQNLFQAGRLPPQSLKLWSCGGVLAKLPALTIAPLLEAMLDHGAEAFAVAVTLMGMHAHGDFEKLDSLRPQLRKCAENTDRWGEMSAETMEIHHFEKIMGWMLEKGRQDPDARATALILASKMTDILKMDNERIVRPLVPLLLSSFPEIAWPLIGQAIIADQVQAWRFEFVLGKTFLLDRNEAPALLSLPEDTLFAWCRANPDRGPAFTATIVPVLATNDPDVPERGLHPVMARLLDEFGDRREVLQAIDHNIHAFCWSGSPSTYYAMYREPLEALHDHSKSQVRLWATDTIDRIDAHIKNAQDEDEEEKAWRDV